MTNEIEEKVKIRCISTYDSDEDYLKAKGIARSKFFRQAVKAHQEDKFKFDFMVD